MFIYNCFPRALSGQPISTGFFAEGVFAAILYLVRPAEGGIKGHLQTLLNHFGQKYSVALAGPGGAERMLPAEQYYRLPLSEGLNPGSDLGAWLYCRRLMGKLRPALAHIHGFKAALIGCPSARLARVPVLMTVHNFPASSFLLYATYP